jgi:dihydrofolate synthase/folylpolyglutamate synthase
MKYLGDTLEQIAHEKAAIAKPGAPFIIGETRPELVETLRLAAACSVRKLDAAARPDIRLVPADYEWRGPLALLGAHQRRNAGVAHGILMALPAPYRPTQEEVSRGFATASIPGRLDRRGKWIFDVAHNPDGMRALVRAVRELDLPRPLHALVSILGDKEWAEMLVLLDQVIDHGVLTLAPTAASRGWDMEWLGRWLKDPSRPPARASWRVVPEFGAALEAAQKGAGAVLVTGSFHTVGDVMGELGLGMV